jgi:ribosome maturation factor RimP
MTSEIITPSPRAGELEQDVCPALYRFSYRCQRGVPERIRALAAIIYPKQWRSEFGKRAWALAHVLVFMRAETVTGEVYERPGLRVEGGDDVQDRTAELESFLAETCAALHLDFYDVEFRSSTLAITVDRPGGLDLDAVAEVARVLSAALDEREEIAPADRYELEVSSPGLERRLRKAQHYQAALGTEIALRLVAGGSGQRRFEATLVAADEQGIEIRSAGAARRVEYAEIERAHTIFDWKAALASSRESAAHLDDGDEHVGAPFDGDVEMTKEQA